MDWFQSLICCVVVTDCPLIMEMEGVFRMRKGFKSFMNGDCFMITFYFVTKSIQITEWQRLFILHSHILFLSLSDTLLFTLSASNSYHLYSIQITTRFILCILSLWWFSSLSLSCFVTTIFSKLIHTFIDVLRYQISSHSNKCNSVIPRFGVYFLSECNTKFCNLYYHFKPIAIDHDLAIIIIWEHMHLTWFAIHVFCLSLSISFWVYLML